MKELIRHILREHTRYINEFAKQTKWTPEMIKDIAKDYQRRSDFQKEYSAASKWAREHGIFDDITSHMQKSKTGKSNTDDFIQKLKQIHGDKYNYDKVDYKGSTTDVTLVCPKHGEFNQKPNKLLGGRGCQKCGLQRLSDINRKTDSVFVDQANIVHDGKYDYSKVDYETARQKVIITCPIHGDFLQTPDHHLKGQGCPKCGNLILGNRKSAEDFLKDAKIVHTNKYDYSKVDFKTVSDKVTIICPKHGEFSQTPSKHVGGAGCPSCSESRGERLVNDILNKHNIEKVREKRFLDCINTLKGQKCLPLPFDFYLPQLNVCIEYDGEQHYMPVSTFGGVEAFERQKKRDKIKNQYCKKNGIKLIRIPYTMKKDEIEPYILKELGIE